MGRPSLNLSYERAVTRILFVIIGSPTNITATLTTIILIIIALSLALVAQGFLIAANTPSVLGHEQVRFAGAPPRCAKS